MNLLSSSWASQRIARVLLGALLACTGCVGADGAADTFVASLAFDQNGQLAVHVLRDAEAPAAAPVDGAIALRYELRDENGELIDQGLVPDPRYGVSETPGGSAPRATLGVAQAGAMVVRLHNVAGQLAVLEPTADGGYSVLARTTLRRWESSADDTSVGSTVGALGFNPLDFAHGPLETLRAHTTPSRGARLLFVSDGYTSGEMGDFRASVQAFVRSLDEHPDYRQYAPSFDLLIQTVPSRQSGMRMIHNVADQAANENPFDERTAFGVACNNQPWGALIPMGPNLRGRARAQALRLAAHADMVVILTNDRGTECGYGGSTIPFEMTVRARGIVDDFAGNQDLLPHELGHGLFHLGDEYVIEPELPGAVCAAYRVIGFPNVAHGPHASDLPDAWRALLTAGVALPTPRGAPEGTVGAFEGASTCAHGFYRAEETCLMGSGIDGPHRREFCRVCRHAMDAFFADRHVAPLRCGDGVCSDWERNGASSELCPSDCGDPSAPPAMMSPPPPMMSPPPSGGAPRCGDGACNNGENCGTCPGDCGSCAAVCPTHAGCDSCAAAPGCGWCGASSACVPCLGADCHPATACAGGWAPVTSNCPAPVAADPCASSTDCGSCTARSTCGWCAGRCRTGTASGSNDGVCSGASWAWLRGQCM